MIANYKIMVRERRHKVPQCVAELPLLHKSLVPARAGRVGMNACIDCRVPWFD